MMIKTTDYDDFKFLIASASSNVSYFDGTTYFVVYSFTTTYAIECKIPAKPATWAADLGVSIPPSPHQLNAPLEFVDY